MSRRPPLPLSPRRLRPRRVAMLTEKSCQTPPGASARKALPSDQPHLLLSGYNVISEELLTLARRVSDEFGPRSGGSSPLGQPSPPYALPRPYATDASPPPLFQRGRMYELYSERRNERLRRRKDDRKDWDLGISGGSEVAKRRATAKRPPAPTATVTKNARKSVEACGLSAVRGAYSLRSSVKKTPTLPFLSSSVAATAASSRAAFDVNGASRLITPRRSVGGVDKRMGTRSCRRN